MSTTSRRRFLKNAAVVATAATTMAACGGDSAPTPAPPGPSGPTGPTGATETAGTGTTESGIQATAANVDAIVASNFLERPVFLEPPIGSTTVASTGFLLYGLLCADFGGKELLVPNSAPLTGTGIHQHTPKLWLHTPRVVAGSAAADGTMAGFSWWNLNSWNLSVQAFDNMGNPVTQTSGALAWRNDPRHPWTDQKWVRCLKDVTNKNILTNRDDQTKVAARMAMPFGSVTAIPPTTHRGRVTVWQQKKHDNTLKENATTDSMVWQVQYPGTPASYRITLTKMGNTAVTKVINIRERDNALLAAVTCAMPMSPGNPLELGDTQAFARLLDTGDPTTYNAPKAITNKFAPMSSGSDGHCECACN